MYNIQIIPPHDKQTHCQPPFPKNMDNLKNFSTNKDWKKKLSPSKSSLNNSNLDNSSTPT
jgi:hypothetical protein